MHYIPLLFLCAKVFSFIYHRELALFLHNFRAIVEERRSAKKVHVVFIDKTTVFFLIYFLIDILFLFYCIWLITGDGWEPAVCYCSSRRWNPMASRDVSPVLMKLARWDSSMPASGSNT